MTTKTARNRPVTTRKGALDTTELQVGQSGVAEFTKGEDSGIEHEIPEVEPVQGVVDHTHAEALAFDNELMTIRVSTTTDKNAEKIVPVWVNGRSQYFPRGIDVTCKRMFVGKLALTKVTSFGNQEYTDSEGIRAVRYPREDGLVYPFSVVRDDNPRGAEWLRNLLLQPA